MQVPAKVNLFLAVRGRRPDAYHELVTILQTVAVCDTVRVELDRLPAAGHPSQPRQLALSLDHGGVAGVPDGRDNLVVRAAGALVEHLGYELVPPAGGAGGAGDEAGPATARLALDKRIPVGAGMAGGSADAAATLVAVNALLDAGLHRDELRAVAAQLGADVPFCVTGGTSLATGTGAATAQVLCRGEFHWVLGMSHDPLSTPEVYAAWDELPQQVEMHPDQALQAVRTGDVELLAASLHNDLQAAAFRLRPGLADAVDAFLVDGALAALISGSGPTVMALAADAGHARALAESARERFDRVEVATSPAGGPRLRVG